MTKGILIIAEPHEQADISELIINMRSDVVFYGSIKECQSSACMRVLKLIIVDLDLPEINNSFISSLKRDNPQSWIFGISSSRYHPHLKDSFRSSLFGVISKPLDEEELAYCLKSLLDD
ncbi:MAG: hypothetical protein ABR542_02130 [Desulfonatronovibrio sp.]|nr:hypothetical protein [Desulfovibrionales bacterium]